MASIDSTNDALYDFLHADAPLLALAVGDVWKLEADEGTLFPYVVFQRVTGTPDYTFGPTLSSDSQLYMVKAYAVDTTAKTGRKLVDQIVDRLKLILQGAVLSIAGSTLLICIPTTDLPAMVEPASQGLAQDTDSGGFYLDIVAA